MKRKRPVKSMSLGCVVVDFQELEMVCRERGHWIETVLRQANLSHHTIERIRKGQPIRSSSLDALNKWVGAENMGRVARSSGSAFGNGNAHGKITVGQSVEEWAVEEVLTRWITASNGLQYRIVKLRHQHLPNTWGRGKCYELGHLSGDERGRMRDRLHRHPIICRKLTPHPRIAVNERVFPDPKGDLYWVVDQWIPGQTLDTRLSGGAIARAELLRISREIAEGLAWLHRHDIVRRELNPSSVLLRELDGSVVLSDFELGKLLDGTPTVAADWPDDPYRAPEVGDGPVDVRADIYSWGRIVTHLFTGTLPKVGDESKCWARIPDAEPWREIVLRCVALPASRRPATMAEILGALGS